MHTLGRGCRSLDLDNLSSFLSEGVTEQRRLSIDGTTLLQESGGEIDGFSVLEDGGDINGGSDYSVEDGCDEE